MSVSQFIHDVRSGAVDFERPDHKLDATIEMVLDRIDVMGTMPKLRLLAHASQASVGEGLYVEAGSYQGGSILAAGLSAPDAQLVAIDNFSQFSGSFDVIRDNVAALGAENIDIVDADVWTYLRSGELRPESVAVWFYDAGHTFHDQYRAIRDIEPYLTDRAVVIVDDHREPAVRAGTAAALGVNARFELVREFRAERNGDPTWWNGVAVLSYDRATPLPTRRLNPGPLMLAAGRLEYDVVLALRKRLARMRR